MLQEKLTDTKYLFTFDSVEEAEAILARLNPNRIIKAAEVMKLLNITRPTLCHYVRDGKIKATKVPGSQYQYDYDSVMKLKK